MSAFDTELPPPSSTAVATILPAKTTDFLRTKPRKPQSERGIVRDWLVVPGVGYQLKITDLGIQFDCTRVRNRYEELYGLLTVRANIRGARVVGDNILSSADFNLSSMRSRQDRAKHLHERASADSIDWLGLLEDLCLRVLGNEERGHPEIALEDIPCDMERSAEIEAGTLPLLPLESCQKCPKRSGSVRKRSSVMSPSTEGTIGTRRLEEFSNSRAMVAGVT